MSNDSQWAYLNVVSWLGTGPATSWGLRWGTVGWSVAWLVGSLVAWLVAWLVAIIEGQQHHKHVEGQPFQPEPVLANLAS